MKASNEIVVVCPLADPAPSSAIPSDMRAAFTHVQFSITMARPFSANLGGGRSYAGMSSPPWDRDDRYVEEERRPT